MDDIPEFDGRGQKSDEQDVQHSPPPGRFEDLQQKGLLRGPKASWAEGEEQKSPQLQEGNNDRTEQDQKPQEKMAVVKQGDGAVQDPGFMLMTESFQFHDREKDSGEKENQGRKGGMEGLFQDHGGLARQEQLRIASDAPGHRVLQAPGNGLDQAAGETGFEGRPVFHLVQDCTMPGLKKPELSTTESHVRMNYPIVNREDFPVNKKTEYLMDSFKILQEFGQIQLPDPAVFEKETGKSVLVRKSEVYYHLLYEWSTTLGKMVYEMFITAKIFPALIVTRELLSQATIFYCYIQSLEKNLKVRNMDALERDMSRIFLHNIADNAAFADLTIGQCLDQVSEKFTGARVAFSQLGEAILPLRRGFSMRDAGTGIHDIHLENLVDKEESPLDIGAKSLFFSLTILNHSFGRLVILFPQFIRQAQGLR